MLTDVSDEPGEATAGGDHGRGGRTRYTSTPTSRRRPTPRRWSAPPSTRFGRLDVLYNNAGDHARRGRLRASRRPRTVWDTVLAVNVKGVAFGCKYGIPAMLGSGGGSIINVASFVAWMGAATSQTAYTASKGAVLAMTREIAVEYARKGIRCNALCPGPIETPLLMQLLSDEAKRQRRFVHIPMGRLGQAEELAKAALFLASRRLVSYMTGRLAHRRRRHHRRLRHPRGLEITPPY